MKWAVTLIGWCMVLGIARGAEGSLEDILARSQAILREAGRAPVPGWLRTEPEAVTDPILARSRAIVDKQFSPAVTDGVEHIGRDAPIIFASFSLGEATLQKALQTASRQSTVVVLRGLPEGATVHSLARDIARLSGDLTPRPDVFVHPQLFREFQIQTVPTVLLRGDGQGVFRGKVEGFLGVGWLRDQLAATPGVSGKDFGVYGEVSSIAEPDLIEDLKHRITKIDWNKKLVAARQNFWARQNARALRPTATSARTFAFTPVTEVAQDILTPDGVVIAQAGQRLKLLEMLPFRKRIVFADLTDDRHLELVAREVAAADAAGIGVLLLTTTLDSHAAFDGISALQRRFGRNVYVASEAHLSRFHIANLPARVHAEGTQFIVSELVP